MTRYGRYNVNAVLYNTLVTLTCPSALVRPVGTSLLLHEEIESKPWHRSRPLWLTLFPLLKGELTITSDMEELSNALFYDSVPDSWTHYAYPSLLSLGAWYADLLLRIQVSTSRGKGNTLGASRSRRRPGIPSSSAQS